LSAPSPIENLFRHESGKLIAVLTKVFGAHQLQLVEDVVQDSMLKALEHWKFHGIPQQPSAWLFTVARNKALDIIRKEKKNTAFSSETVQLLSSDYSVNTTQQEMMLIHPMEDEQLHMMFVCCHPLVAEEGQVALILKTLCGFSTAEIARAFLTNEETITKRLYRAKEVFRQKPIPFQLPSNEELQIRLDNVLTAIYLIFNEGYHSSHNLSIVREELIEDSLRLGKILVENPLTQKPNTFALLALMCFNAARAQTRTDGSGQLLQLSQQNRLLWNKALIDQGNLFLNRASGGNSVTHYHIEAAIAYEHCNAATYAQTNWQKIIDLYEWLYTFKPMPLVRLNQLIAYAEWKGAEAALEKLKTTQLPELLQQTHLFFATLAEWHARTGHTAESIQYFEKAIALCQSDNEMNFFKNRIHALQGS
jgi:RNA polymerase sigma-70 factor (ECF subfamily)